MGRFYAQAILRSTSGMTEDDQVNGWSLGQIGSLPLGDAQFWVSAISGFYDDVRLLGGLKGSAEENHLVKIYDIEGAAPNYPLYELPFDLPAAPGAIELPQEVALCLSYTNTQAVTVPRARRRGRIYLSGWSEVANDAGRPSNATVDGLVAAALAYDAAVLNSVTSLEPSIWSRANGTTYRIDQYWADNEWDTMRSRGSKPTYRKTSLVP